MHRAFPDLDRLKGIAVARCGAGVIGGGDDETGLGQGRGKPAEARRVAPRSMGQQDQRHGARAVGRIGNGVKPIEQRVLGNQAGRCCDIGGIPETNDPFLTG